MSSRRSTPGPCSLRSLAAAAAALSIAAACSGKDPYSPGTKLGTFHVTAALTHTSCGATPNPWEFDVKLNHDGSTLYWIQGGAPIEGRIDPSARAQLEAEIVEEVRAADPRGMRGACALARTDALALTLLGSDAAPTTDPALATGFNGQLVFTFAPTPESDCADQIATAGGGFEALPCEVHYDVSGALQASSR